MSESARACRRSPRVSRPPRRRPPSSRRRSWCPGRSGPRSRSPRPGRRSAARVVADVRCQRNATSFPLGAWPAAKFNASGDQSNEAADDRIYFRCSTGSSPSAWLELHADPLIISRHGVPKGELDSRSSHRARHQGPPCEASPVQGDILDAAVAVDLGLRGRHRGATARPTPRGRPRPGMMTVPRRGDGEQEQDDERTAHARHRRTRARISLRRTTDIENGSRRSPRLGYIVRPTGPGTDLASNGPVGTSLASAV